MEVGLDVVAGADCHKASHSIVFLDRIGVALETLTIETTAAGYERAIARARELGDVQWGLESTGCYGAAFAQALLTAGFRVYEVPGVVTKRHRSRSSRRGKSDPLDAHAIAEAVLREHDRLPLYSVSPEREAIRLRYDQRDRLIRERTQTINRLRSTLLRLGIEEPTTLTARRTLAKLARVVSDRRGVHAATDALVDDAVYAIDDILRIEKRTKEVERILDPLVRKITPELLEMRGVSIVTAAGLVGHSGDLRNCRNADAFAMRSGTAPIPCSSGTRSRDRVNVGGNRQLKNFVRRSRLIRLKP